MILNWNGISTIYFEELKQLNETLFKPGSVFCGVLLGLILGPAIFLIFFNNFPGTATNCETIQFADDSVIFVSYKDVDSIEFMLNEDLKSVSSYFVKYKLEILKHMKPNVCSLACLQSFRPFSIS